MRTKDIKIGGVYVAKVSGTLQKVRITRVNYYSGWDAINIATGRIVHVRSPQRLRYEVVQNTLVYDHSGVARKYDHRTWPVGTILVLRSPHVDVTSLVNYRGKIDNEFSCVVYLDNGHQTSIPTAWLEEQKGQEVQRGI